MGGTESGMVVLAEIRLVTGELISHILLSVSAASTKACFPGVLAVFLGHRPGQ